MITSLHHNGVQFWPIVEPCWCRRCEVIDWEAGKWPRFIVCPECGNKRCPRATFHEHACTGSNEPGQPGSDYA